MRAMKSSRVKRNTRTYKKSETVDVPTEYLFSPRQQLRKLRVVIDCDSKLYKNPSAEFEYLLGLLQQESILMWRYSDDGPPEGALRADTKWAKGVIGWINVTENGTFTLASTEDVTSLKISRGSIDKIAVDDHLNLSYENLDSGEAARRRFKDVQLLQIVHEANIDLLVTDRSYLYHDAFSRVSSGPTEVITLSEALPIVGLYLRAQNQYVVEADSSGSFAHAYDKGLMTWAASRALLPAGWRWMSACVQHAIYTDNNTLTHYASTAHHRVEQALVARDELFVALNRPQDSNTADDALSALDTILISLSAALDVTARVMNYALDTGLQPHIVGWSRKEWRKATAKLSSDVKQLLADQDFIDVITVLGSLRNTIHGAGLNPLAVSDDLSRERTETLVGLPFEQLDALLEAMDRLGGHEQWGIRKLIPGRAHAEVDILCERIIATILPVINRIMEITPVEKLEGVSLTATDLKPNEDPQSPFEADKRRNILLQYGLEEPA